MNEVETVRTACCTAYMVNGVSFEFMTTATLFLILVDAGELRRAAEWKEAYAI